MKKTKKASSAPSHPDKGFLELAGEAMSVLGHEIVEGKDHLVSAARRNKKNPRRANPLVGLSKTMVKPSTVVHVV